jgi:hypothetical protein
VHTSFRQERGPASLLSPIWALPHTLSRASSLGSNPRIFSQVSVTFSGIALHLVLSLFAWTNNAYAQSTVNASLCDAQITNNSDDVFGYRFRGNRCEGRYQQPTAAPPPDLTIVSFACPSPGFTLGSSKPMLVWSSANDSPVSIRIETLPQIRLRYRLDAVDADGNSRFTWDSDTWRALSIDPSELGIVIKGHAKLGDNELPGTLLQARLGTDAKILDCPSGPTFHVRTGERLASLKICAKALEKDGQATGKPICQTVTGLFFPNKSIEVSLGVLKSATHLLQISLEGSLPSGVSGPPRYFRVKVD